MLEEIRKLEEMRHLVGEVVREELDRFNDGFEDRLATSFRKALDTVTAEYEERLSQVEEDLARVLRHTGLGGDE